jgi:hypothetical protein
VLFTENETNYERLFPGQHNASPYVKDGINKCDEEVKMSWKRCSRKPRVMHAL